MKYLVIRIPLEENNLPEALIQPIVESSTVNETSLNVGISRELNDGNVIHSSEFAAHKFLFEIDEG